MGIRAWLERRRKQKETDVAVQYIFERMLGHINSGGKFEDFMIVPLFEAVEWDMERQSWAIVVLDGGVSWENGSSVVDGEKLRKGQRVSLMSGRGGRIEDAVIVSGRKVVGGGTGYKYLLDFESTGGAEPWFLELL